MTHADFKLNKVSLVMLGVKDFPKSVAFYRDTLGLQVQGRRRCDAGAERGPR